MLCASSAWSSSFCSSVRRLGSGAGAGPPPMAPAARTARVSPRNLAQTRPRPPAAGYSRLGAPPPTVGCAAAGCGDPPALVESGLISAFPLSTSLCGNPQNFAGVDSTWCFRTSCALPFPKLRHGICQIRTASDPHFTPDSQIPDSRHETGEFLPKLETCCCRQNSEKTMRAEGGRPV